MSFTMTMDTTNTTDTYQQHVAQIVSQAAIHLYDAEEPVGIALYDQDGGVIFDDGATHYTDESALKGAIVDCMVNPLPGTMFQCDSETTTAFAMNLDGQYMFVMVGHHFEDGAIDKFLANLHQMLPQLSGSNN